MTLETCDTFAVFETNNKKENYEYSRASLIQCLD